MKAKGTEKPGKCLDAFLGMVWDLEEIKHWVPNTGNET